MLKFGMKIGSNKKYVIKENKLYLLRERFETISPGGVSKKS